jgi:hypothetical protein
VVPQAGSDGEGAQGGGPLPAGPAPADTMDLFVHRAPTSSEPSVEAGAGLRDVQEASDQVRVGGGARGGGVVEQLRREPAGGGRRAGRGAG